MPAKYSLGLGPGVEFFPCRVGVGASGHEQGFRVEVGENPDRWVPSHSLTIAELRDYEEWAGVELLALFDSGVSHEDILPLEEDDWLSVGSTPLLPG